MRVSGALVAVLVVGVACQGRQATPSGELTGAVRDSISAVVRAESERMLVVMRERDPDSVLAFYGRRAAYVGNGEIGDWPAIVAGTKPRYATYTKVDCRWGAGFRIDVLSPSSAVVTGLLLCEKADTSGKTWKEDAARTEVVAVEDLPRLVERRAGHYQHIDRPADGGMVKTGQPRNMPLRP